MNSFRQLPGASLDYGDLFALADAIREAFDAGAAGAVVTQGTDTIEETAYFLDLMNDGRGPVVVTGAMRNPTMVGADGPANLLAALRVASRSESPGATVVVFADEIHAANQVSKAHSTSVTAFESWPGPVGYVAEDRVIYRAAVSTAPRLAALRERGQHAARTALLTVTLGDDGQAVEAVGQRAGGVVVAGFGAGHVPSSCVPALEKLAGRIPVILATRTGRGPVLAKTYGFPGSESDLLARGLISAGELTPVKAKVQLHAALMLGASAAEIRTLFEEGLLRESR